MILYKLEGRPGNWSKVLQNMSSTFPFEGTDEGIWVMYKSEGVFIVRALFDSEKAKNNYNWFKAKRETFAYRTTSLEIGWV